MNASGISIFRGSGRDLFKNAVTAERVNVGTYCMYVVILGIISEVDIVYSNFHSHS